MKLRCTAHNLRVHVYATGRTYHPGFTDECPHANDIGGLMYGRHYTYADSIVQAKIQGYRLRRWFA